MTAALTTRVTADVANIPNIFRWRSEHRRGQKSEGTLATFIRLSDAALPCRYTELAGPGAGAYGPHPGDRLASGEGEQRECGDIEAIRRSMVALPQLCSLPPWPVTHVDYDKGLPFEFDADAISSHRQR